MATRDATAAWHERAGCLVGSSARPGRQRSSSVAHKPDRTEFGVSRRRAEPHVRCGTADPARTCVLEAGTRRQLRGAHGWDRTGGDRRSSSDLSLDGTTSWWRWLRAVERGTRRCAGRLSQMGTSCSGPKVWGRWLLWFGSQSHRSTAIRSESCPLEHLLPGVPRRPPACPRALDVPAPGPVRGLIERASPRGRRPRVGRVAPVAGPGKSTSIEAVLAEQIWRFTWPAEPLLREWFRRTGNLFHLESSLVPT